MDTRTARPGTSPRPQPVARLAEFWQRGPYTKSTASEDDRRWTGVMRASHEKFRRACWWPPALSPIDQRDFVAESSAARLAPMHPLAVALVVSTLATLLSRYAPASLASSLVGLTFLAASYGLCMRRGRASHFGLAFGGLTEDAHLDARRLTRETLNALGWALAAALIVLPPFWMAPLGGCAPRRGILPGLLADQSR
jgi:hypothetical protein